MIHPTSEVQTSQIGEGTTIWQNCVVLSGAVIGKNCNINYNVFIENEVILGDQVTIKSGVQLWDGITVEDKVIIGPNVTFTNDSFPRSKQYPEKFLRTLIREGASIGANSTIMGGITIGKYAMIGAASLVTRDVPDFALCYGSPARIHGYVCQCGNKLDTALSCSVCSKNFVMVDGLITEQ